MWEGRKHRVLPPEEVQLMDRIDNFFTIYNNYIAVRIVPTIKRLVL